MSFLEIGRTWPRLGIFCYLLLLTFLCFFCSYNTSYRVLTPTMYRSRMACARQTVSMDYDDDSAKKARLRREGPSMRGPSPLLRPGKLLKAQRSSGEENSLDLELGASATRVHQLPSTSSTRNQHRRLSPNVHSSLGEQKAKVMRNNA